MSSVAILRKIIFPIMLIIMNMEQRKEVSKRVGPQQLIGTFIINVLLEAVAVQQQFIIVLPKLYNTNITNIYGRRRRNFVLFFSFFSHHIIVKSSKCQPRCNITIYWKGIDLLGHCGDDILSLAQKQRHLLAIKYIKFCLYQ